MSKPIPFGPLKALGEEKFAEVAKRVDQGMPATMICRMIQKDWGLLGTMGESPLTKMLQRFAKHWHSTKVAALVADGRVTASEGFVKNIDIVTEAEGLYELQKERVAKVKKTEDGMNTVILKQMSEELDRLWTNLMALKVIYQEYGLVKKTAKKTFTSTVVTGPDGTRISTVELTEDDIDRIEAIKHLDPRKIPVVIENEPRTRET